MLDSSVAISAERRGLSVEALLTEIRDIIGPQEVALSVVRILELEHGIWRAKEVAHASRRQKFLGDLIDSVPVVPITTDLARKAGRIDAEQQARGIRIAFQDLLIGVSALELDYGLGTHNVRHFELIPNLKVKRFA